MNSCQQIQPSRSKAPRLSSLALGALALALLFPLHPSSLLTPPRAESQELKKPRIRKHQISATFESRNGKSFPIGLGSGLSVGSPTDDGSLELLMVSDRGPNASAPQVTGDAEGGHEGKFFLAPDFVPQIARIRIDKNGELLSQETIALRSESGQVSGLIPPLPGAVMPEEALSLEIERLDRTPLGFDPEGITSPRDGVVWLADEYRPGLLEVELNSGTIRRVLAPEQGLPGILAARQPNRGFEGVTMTPSGSIVAIVQSTLDVEGQTKSTSPLIRIVVLEPESGEVSMYAYAHGASNDIEDIKLGDITAISDSEFVLIHAGASPKGEKKPYLVAVSLEGATPLKENISTKEQPEVIGDLAAAGVVPVKRRVLADLTKFGWDHSKTEGLAILPDGKTLAITDDNDFGTAVKLKLDIEDLLLSKEGDLRITNTAFAKHVALDVKEVPTSLWFLTFSEDLRALF